MKTSIKYFVVFAAACALALVVGAGAARAGEAWLDSVGIRIDNVNMNNQHVTNKTYWIDPPFLSAKVQPNVLIVFDASNTMKEPAYRSAYDPTQFVSGKYYGYFEPDTMYQYGNNNQWSPTTLDTAAATVNNPIAKGDFLNWAYMAKIEIVKRLLLGGKANPRSMGNQCCVKLVGENFVYDASKYYDNSLNPPADMNIYPFAGNHQYYRSGDALLIAAVSTANTVYLYPTGNLESNNTWAPSGAPTAWQAVDEHPNDGDATRISNTSTQDRILFDYDYAGANIGTITNVSIEVVAKKSSNTQMNLQGVLRFTYGGNTTYHAGSLAALSTSYRTINVASWNTNPATGLNWDWGDIRSVGVGAMDGFGIMAVGSGNSNPSASAYPTVSEVRLIVTTTTPNGGPYNLTIDTGKSDVRGIMDDLSEDARFGLALYNSGERFEVGGGGSRDAGYIDTDVAFGQRTNMITTIGNLFSQSSGTAWSPLAETLYEMTGYFRQDTPYYNNTDYRIGTQYDPYYYRYSLVSGSTITVDQYVPCAKSFVLLLTDGEATMDRNIPDWLKDYDGDGRDAPLCSNCNYASDYVDDVAYYARQNDHRPDLTGTQNIIVYPVFMFGNGSSLLMETAINGGYDDLDGNGRPGCKFPATAGAPTQDELRECYRDSNDNQVIDPYHAASNPHGDLPLTYFQGNDGYELQASIIDAIAAILRRAASGTSVSVLGSSWKGEGSMYQAYFYPEKVEGMRRIKWTGYFHSLFVDRHGLIHEDTNGDGIMKPDDDYVLEFEFQSGQDTRIKYFYDRVNNANPSDNHPDGIVDSSVPIRIISINDVRPLWDGGKMLARRDPADRAIYVSIDADTAAPPTTNPTVIDFRDGNAPSLRPFLRAKTDAAAANLINFIRGAEIDGWRDRKLDVDGSLMTWKLGDIVYSDPVVVAAPKERFDLIYNDRTYAEFYNKWAKRRSVVYVGGNDGMLHAFNSGFYISTTETNPASNRPQIVFCTSLDPSDPTRCGPNDADKPLGKELWGFIPFDVLPHLAWLADKDYMHTYYVDNMVRVTDARIFTADADHPNGWGTVLLISLRFGGGEIDVTDTFGGVGSTTKQFKSAYYALDVTNPEIPPKLIWRFTDREMGFTLSTPTIVREEAAGTDHWYAVMGSGPTNYYGGRAVDNTTEYTKFTTSGAVAALNASVTMSTTYPYLYVINLATGSADSGWTAPSGGRNGVFVNTDYTRRFMTSVTAVDYPLDYKYDMIYFGSMGCNSNCNSYGYGTWGGRVFRLRTNNDIDPGHWVLSDAFYAAQPITAKPAVGLDQRGNIWVYFGTGRFLHIDDRFDSTTENYYGFKDKCYYSGCTTVTSNGSNLLDANDYTVNVDGTITPSLAADALGAGKPSSAISRFDDLAAFMRDQADGWRIRLGAGERVIVNGFVVGGISGFGSYTPTQTICEFDGRSRQYYPYYLTGTVPYIPGGSYMYSVYVDSGGGLPSVPAVHIDSAGNVKLFLQKSTGEIKVLEMKQAQAVTGGLGAGGECNPPE